MRYSVDKLVIEDTPKKYLFFWGHAPSKDGTVTKTCFSQWWEAPFTVEGIEYKTAEHWMMYKKAELFGDKDTGTKIIEASSPAEAKKLGREVQGYIDDIWLEHRYNIVKEGNYHKFSQNEHLKEFLLTTRDRILVEASPVDAIWGIGIAVDHSHATHPHKWRGLNLLGFALMEVRDELQQ